jgi:hypothetical protein
MTIGFDQPEGSTVSLDVAEGAGPEVVPEDSPDAAGRSAELGDPAATSDAVAPGASSGETAG